MADDVLLTTDGLVCGYDEPLLGPLDFEFDAGEFVLVEGPNGIGKSTFLKTLVGLQPPLSGGYEWRVERSGRRFVPQVRTLDPVLPATVEDVVATGGLRGNGWQGLQGGASRAEVERGLEQFGMEEHRGALFRELSEGQKQLVLLARAMVGEPEVCVLDEPTASMDPEREREAMEELGARRERRGMACFVVAHGSTPAREAATQLLEIDRERNVELRAASRSGV